jgi:hypothetical protein
MSIEYPASESGQGLFSHLDKEADAHGSEATGAGSAAKRIAWYEMGAELAIEMLGELCKAMVIEASSCDPHNEKLRA